MSRFAKFPLLLVGMWQTAGVAILAAGLLASPAAAQDGQACVFGYPGIGFAGRAYIKRPGEYPRLTTQGTLREMEEAEQRNQAISFTLTPALDDPATTVPVILGQRHCLPVPAGEGRSVFIIDRWDWRWQGNILNNPDTPKWPVLVLIPHFVWSGGVSCSGGPCSAELPIARPVGGLGLLGQQTRTGYAVCDTGPIPAGQSRTVNVWGTSPGGAQCTVVIP